MSRKRLAALGTLGAAVFAAAGAAVAAHAVQSTQSASATFTATTVSKAHTTTCTGSDGTYQDTNAWYSGTATSSVAQLNGPITIHAHSVVNTTTGLGWLDGDLRIGTGHPTTHAKIHAAISGGNAAGAVTGDAPHPGNKLVASFFSPFTQSGGFTTGGNLGGSSSGAGVIFTHGPCAKAKHLASTFVFRLGLTGREAVPPTVLKAKGDGSLTIDVTRDSTGTITGGTAAFNVNYRFGGAVTLNSLALYQGAKGTNAASASLDAAIGTISDPDGQGNVTKSVSIGGSLAQALLANPKGYYVQLNTNLGNLRDQLGGPAHH